MNQSQESCINFIEWFRSLLTLFTPQGFIFKNPVFFNEQIVVRDGFSDARMLTGQVLLGIHGANDVVEYEPEFRRFVSVFFILEVVRDAINAAWRPYTVSVQGFRNGYYVYDPLLACWFQREAIHGSFGQQVQ